MDMSLSVWLLTAIVAIALLFLVNFVDYFWRHSRMLCEAIIALLLVGLPCIVASTTPIMSIKVLLVTTQLWMLLLPLRILAGRFNEAFLRQSTRRNIALASFSFAGILFVALLIGLFGSYEPLIFLLLLGSLLVGSMFVYQVIWTLQHYRLRKLNKYLTSDDLPAITLAIPARNETHALHECLAAAVASDYAKLEVLVLDDCSQDKTSEIIRSFAHDGVRFVQGELPADGWLGKNQACKTLTEQASGEYIVFAGVDTRLDPDSLRQLVTYAVSKDVDMVSVLPQRRDGLRFATILWQLRYYWQIVLPITHRRVPIASQCWLIRVSALEAMGGFDSVKHKIVPEGTFARRLFRSDRYRFIISNTELGITTAKRWTSQVETAVRFLYPTFKRQPFYVYIGSLLLVFGALLPFAYTFALPFFGPLNVTWILALLVCFLLMTSYALVVVRTLPRTWLVSLIAFPISLMQELVLLVTSMLAYEFAEVNWKGRNVCYPVMTAYAHLPEPPRRKA